MANPFMNTITSVEPAIDPTNRPTFLLDWELTMKCNLDCAYCPTGIESGGHDNSSSHPPLADCLKSIDFMYEYADQYMSMKPSWQRMVVLNVYGGESVFHPNIVEILEQVKARHAQYAHKWPLTVTCTSNGVAGTNVWSRVAALIDEFTISFHSTALPKQRQQVLDNLLFNKSINRRQKVVFVMHNDPEMWNISQEAIAFCKQHDIKHIVKANDNTSEQWQYNQAQYGFLKDYYASKTSTKSLIKITPLNEVKSATVGMGNVGRSCCGGRKLCSNQDLKHPVAFMPATDFRDWYCSVNWYFLYIKQVTGDVYTNKDCRMNFSGKVGPLGNIANATNILNDLKKIVDKQEIPVIQCVKDRCICGYCAPKAQSSKDFEDIMQKHVDSKVKFTYNTSLDDK